MANLDHKHLPQLPGVYLFKSGTDILYIGKAKNLKSRVSSYFSAKPGPRTARMLERATSIDHILVESEFSALLLESRLINKYQPPYNVVSRDDKSPLYIVITKEKFPRVRTARKQGLADFPPRSAIFGPFPSGSSVKWVLKRLRHIFPYCESKGDVGRPCLHSHLGLCRPCPRELTRHPDPLGEKTYRLNLLHLKRVLSGDLSGVIRILAKNMQAASLHQDFETATFFRNQIQKLEWLKESSTNTDEYLANPNLIEDQAILALTSLKDLLGLPSLPQRIECYDISHTGKSSASSAMVVVTNGQLDPAQYRHFKIKLATVPNDVASISETLTRRLRHPEWGTPDLIVIDGGKPQLSAALGALKSTYDSSDFPRVIALAKRLEELYLPNQPKPLRLGLKDPGLSLLIRLRNEAHRFSRRLHHQLRSKSLFR